MEAKKSNKGRMLTVKRWEDMMRTIWRFGFGLMGGHVGPLPAGLSPAGPFPAGLGGPLPAGLAAIIRPVRSKAGQIWQPKSCLTGLTSYPLKNKNLITI